MSITPGFRVPSALVNITYIPTRPLYLLMRRVLEALLTKVLIVES
jgi:hypothetical protein